MSTTKLMRRRALGDTDSTCIGTGAPPTMGAA
jgi:hypothetical protein